MKTCPTCKKAYDDAFRFCQSDGTALVGATPQQQAVPPPPRSGDPFSTAEPADDMMKTIVSTPPSVQAGASQGEESPFSKPSDPLSNVSWPSPDSRDSTEPPTVVATPAITFGAPGETPQSAIESNWTPQPPPVSGWGDQGAASPLVGTGTQNKTFALLSLIFGILSVPCCGFLVFAVAALVLGFVAVSKEKSEPANYGGRGMAIAGIVLGAVSLVLGLLSWVLNLASIYTPRF